MTKGGFSREKEFEEYFLSKKMKDMLCGKIEWGNSDLKISVDNSIFTDKYIFLVEIDSSNYAKLVCGQYTLINILKDQPVKSEIKEKFKNKELIFVIIHCYNSKNRKFNTQRTRNNLNLINKNCFNNKGIKYSAFHFEDFKKETGNFIKKEEFCKYFIKSIKNNFKIKTK